MDTTATGSSPQGRSVDAGRGLSWWSEAWALFMRNPGMWVVLGLILLVAFIALSLVPFLGTLAAGLLMPVFAASWMQAARKAEAGGTLVVNDLFTGFQDQAAPLMVLGAVLMAVTFVIGIVAAALGVGSMMGLVMGGAHNSLGTMFAAMGTGMLALLVLLVLGALAGMALWFAPALVVFQRMAPVDALKASFAACLKNVVPFLLWSVLYLVASVIASIPFGLGWVVLVPVLLLSVYTSYNDVFGA
ncbi:MAG: BPSS1780 family membrane protein [Burkholderiales bacterium]